MRMARKSFQRTVSIIRRHDAVENNGAKSGTSCSTLRACGNHFDDAPGLYVKGVGERAQLSQ